MGDEVTLQVFEGTEGIRPMLSRILGQVAYTESERPVGWTFLQRFW